MNEQDVVSFFTGKGYEPHQAAGIAGNLMQESTLNPTAKNPTSGAFGLAQWLGSRKKSFMDFALKNKKDIKDPTAQLEFIDHELNTTETRARDKLLNSKDATEAAFNFSDHYERAGANEKKNATRANYANRILSSIVPSAQAGENMDQPLSYDEWVASGKPKTAATSEIPSRKSAASAPLSYDEWVASGKPKTADEAKGLHFDPLKAVYNAPSSVSNLISGTVEALTHPQDIVKTAAGGLYNLSQAIPGKATPVENRYTSAVKPDQAYMQDAIAKANAVGGVYKERYGSVQKFLSALEKDPAAVAADISILFTGGASAARNLGAAGVANKLAVASNITNPFTLPVMALQKAAPIVTKPASAITNYIANVVDPAAAVRLNAAEGQGANIVNALRNNPEIVPGSMPTAGQAAEPAKVTKYAALQKELSDYLSTEYLARTTEQNAARKAVASKLAGTEAEKAAAISARDSSKAINYGLSDVQTAKANATLTDLLSRPSMDLALSKAKELAKEEGASFGIGVNKPASQRQVRDPVSLNMVTITDPAQFAQYTGRELDYLKKGIDELLAKPKDNGLGPNQIRAIQKTKEQYLNWVDNEIPAYKTARETYGAQSKVIDQMDVAQYLKDKLESPLTEEKLRPGVFATAVKEAPKTIKNVLNQPRFSKLEDVLTPDQMAKIDSLSKEFERQANFETQASAGAKAGRQIPEASLGKLPNFLSKVVTFANAIISRLEGKLSQKLAIDLAYEMLSPERAATGLTKAMERQASMQQRGAAITGASAKVLQGAKSPTGLAAGQVNNALSNQENRNALAQ
jgi:hypothetical protein